MDDDQSCPHCKTSKYRNPSLKLYVNVCGHALCENCVDLLFLKGSGQCTQCGRTLRRTNFRLRLFDDDFVEKEVDIRKKILKDFNKKEDDFETLSEYDNYLEKIETLIYNLTNGIDVEETEEYIDNYKKENSELIEKNKNRLSKDEQFIEILLENGGVAPKTKILSDVQFSTGIKVGTSSNVYLPPTPFTESQPYVYKRQDFNIRGPKMPKYQELLSRGYLNHVRPLQPDERSGGFLQSYPCIRALQEAFSGLYFKS